MTGESWMDILQSGPADDSSEVRENDLEGDVFLGSAQNSPSKDTVVSEVVQSFRDECYKTPSLKRKAENKDVTILRENGIVAEYSLGQVRTHHLERYLQRI